MSAVDDGYLQQLDEFLIGLTQKKVFNSGESLL